MAFTLTRQLFSAQNSSELRAMTSRLQIKKHGIQHRVIQKRAIQKHSDQHQSDQQFAAQNRAARIFIQHGVTCGFFVAILCLTLAVPCPIASAQDSPEKRDVDGEVLNANSQREWTTAEALRALQGNDSKTDRILQRAEREPGIQFKFDREPWRNVIQWIAEECELALHYEDLPTGSFSYTDPADFTQQGALDRLNLFLLPQGYSLVQSGTLLSVINLSDPRSMQTLDALAKFVSVDDLEQLDAQDVVKCIFPLGELDVEDAMEELSVLNLMTTPKPFNKTNQLMLTDTVSKLRNVKAVISSFQPETLDNGTVVRNFTLKHVDAEDILSVARPHLGLATGEMIGIDVSISADLEGKNIFVTGVEDKVKLIETLIADLDVDKNILTAGNDGTTLQSHLVRGGNVEMVYNVLQTLLAGKEARLSMDEEASSIVALGSHDVQLEIAQTVQQLESVQEDFEIIQLKHVDPYFVISLLEEMLDLPSSLDDPDDYDSDTPKIDADPGNMRLFVRGKQHRIDQIKKIVAGLDVAHTGSNERIRLLPIRGETAERVLETGARFWQGDNPIIFYPTPQNERRSTERAIHEPSKRYSKKARLTSVNSTASELAPRYLTESSDNSQPAIRAQMTPRGLLLQCDDTQALKRLTEDLQVIAGPTASTPSPPIVFYLKYVEPEDALRMLAELLDGGESAKEGEAGTLVNGYVSSSSSLIGSLVTARDGLLTLMAGTATVVADPRLNRLIAQGTVEDIDMVESYLEIIDKDKGITPVETHGSSHIVELEFTDATEVAETIREAYAGRILSSKGNAAGGAAAGQANRPERKDDNNEKAKAKAPKASAARAPAINLDPKMTIAVHESSNSIVVTAPDQLYQEVRKLIEQIDTQSETTVEIIAPSNTALLQAMFGEEREPRSDRSRSNSSRSTRGSSGNSSDRLQSILKQRFGR